MLGSPCVSETWSGQQSPQTARTTPRETRPPPPSIPGEACTAATPADILDRWRSRIPLSRRPDRTRSEKERINPDVAKYHDGPECSGGEVRPATGRGSKSPRRAINAILRRRVDGIRPLPEAGQSPRFPDGRDDRASGLTLGDFFRLRGPGRAEELRSRSRPRPSRSSTSSCPAAWPTRRRSTPSRSPRSSTAARWARSKTKLEGVVFSETPAADRPDRRQDHRHAGR